MKRLALYFENGPDDGGGGQYIFSVLRALAQFNGIKYTVKAWYTNELWASHLKDLHIDGELTSYHPYLNIYNRFIKYNRSKMIYKIAVDILHKTAPVTQKIALWRPDILFVPHDNYVHIDGNFLKFISIFDIMHRYEDFPEVSGFHPKNLREAYYLGAINNGYQFIVDSHIGKIQCVEAYNMHEKKIHELPFAPSLPSVTLDASPPKNVNCDLLGDFVFYPAQFWKHKNHVNLLKAMAHLINKGIDITCVLTGNVNQNGFEDIKKAISRYNLYDKVFILGFVSHREIVWLYKNAKCMCMPTYLGPTNIPPLEAMFFGCPVATSRVYGIQEQLKDGAIYFDPSSYLEIAETIEKIIFDLRLREQLISAGKIVAASYSHEKFTERLIQIFDTSLSLNN